MVSTCDKRLRIAHYTEAELTHPAPPESETIGNGPRAFQGEKGLMVAKLLKGVALLIIGAFVALMLSGFGVMNMFQSNPFQVSQVDRSQPVLLKSVQDISQFHSAVGNFEVVLDIEEDVDWMPELIAGRRTLFVAAGTVNAYVDFSSIADEDLKLSPDGKSVAVRLPEPKLDKPNLDFDRSYIYGQDRGLFDRIADAIETPQQEKFFQEAETKMAAAAGESELRKQAADNTQAMLTGMFGGMGIQTAFQ
jgi:hypothetical protein